MESELYIEELAINDTIGFMNEFVKNNEMTFKLKQSAAQLAQFGKRTNTGVRCDKQILKDVVKTMMSIDPEGGHLRKYDSKQLRGRKDYLCKYQEFLMRISDRLNRNEKRWFFSPVDAIINKISSRELMS